MKGKKTVKRFGVVAVSLWLLLGMSSPQSSSTTDEKETSPSRYTRVTIPQTDGKIAPTLRPRGAKMDEVVEVIVQFEGNPVLKEYANAKANGQTLNKKSQQEHAQRLVEAKKNATNRVIKHNGMVISSFEKVYNGLYVQIRRGALTELVELQEVENIYAVNPVELHNDSSVSFIGAPKVWEKVVDGMNVTGKGVSVAVIDTGMDYTHASFGGEGATNAYTSNDPNVVEEGTFPTKKVVGGHDFVGTNYDASSDDPARRVPHPDQDPLDEHGHGTHVGATVAGEEVEGKVGRGVAPDALLYAYKVFGKSGSTGVTTQALEMAADPNRDGDVSDHVDVINMSLGSPYGHPNDPTAVASNLAVEAGIIVVASAGNSGDVPYVTGSPAVAEKAISVAASVDDGVVVGGFYINSPQSLAGQYEAVEGAITTSLAETGDITEDVTYIGRGCNGDGLKGNTESKMALIDRGTCTFSEKLNNAKDAGAIAAVVVNNIGGDPITMGGTAVNLPGVMIRKSDGNRIKQTLASGENVNLTLSDNIKVPKPWLADTIASFSSKGPGRALNGLKPEISAPGFDIRSADVGSGDAGTIKSGTSMAAPHISGVSALLRQLHPNWDSETIKSLIMNTATPIQDLSEKVYPLSRQGAGRVQVEAAGNATTVIAPQALSLGYIAVSDNVQIERSKNVTVTNKSNALKDYRVHWENRQGDRSGPVRLTLPDSISVNAGTSKKIIVDFAIDAVALPSDSGFHEIDGYLVFTEKSDTGEVLRIPYQAVVEKVSEVKSAAMQDAIQLRNNGSIESITDLFILGGQDGVEKTITDHYDVRAIGARVVDEEVAEFVVATEQAWDSPNLVEFNIYIDNNNDEKPDYVVYNQDYYSFFGLDPIGQQITAVYDVAQDKTTPQYFVNVGGSWNHGFMGLPFPKSLAGENGTLEYKVVAWGVDSEQPDTNDGGWIPFNVEQPAIQFESNRVRVPSRDSTKVNVTLETDRQKVIMVNNSDATKPSYSIVELTAK